MDESTGEKSNLLRNAEEIARVYDLFDRKTCHNHPVTAELTALVVQLTYPHVQPAEPVRVKMPDMVLRSMG